MKKTLLITSFFPPRIGGIENYFHNLCSNLDADKIIVLTQEDQNTKEFDNKQKYSIYRTDFFDGKFPPRWRSLKKKVKKIIDEKGIEQIAFGNFHFYNLVGLKFGLPYICYGHGTDIASVGDKFGSKWAFKKVYGGCKHFIANSQYLAHKIEKLAEDNSKIKVIYCGVNVEALNSPVEDLIGKKKIIGISESDIVLLSVGRLVEIKNYAGIIKLMPLILQTIPNLKYVIVGGGPKYLELVDLATQLGVANNVKFVGAVPDETSSKAFYYQMAHIFIGVSKVPEGLGISYLEAQACRTPIIASNTGGATEAVINNKTGLLVNADNDNEIVDAIISLAKDSELWTRLADNGQNMIKQEFDLSVQIKKNIEILS